MEVMKFARRRKSVVVYSRVISITHKCIIRVKTENQCRGVGFSHGL
jgi:hypothetical protein